MNILQKHSEIMKSIYALAVVCVIAMAQIAFAADKVAYKGNWSNLAEIFANKKQGTLLTNTADCIRSQLLDEGDFDFYLAEADIKACAPTNRCVDELKKFDVIANALGEKVYETQSNFAYMQKYKWITYDCDYSS